MNSGMTRILMLAAFLSGALAAANDKLAGLVTDSTGGSIAAVTIEVADVSANTAARARTDSEGKFTVGTLPPGEYVLSVSKKGFEPHRQTVTLSGADAFVRVALTIAKQQYSITVDGGSSQMDTASAAHQDAFTVDQKTFSDLPVKDGDILSALSSFVNPAGGAAATIIVDGMERTDADLPLSSIQQVRINNNAYSAEFPKPGKGRIEIDTRGGDDTLHGGLIIRARNAIFDARNPLANERLPFTRNGYDANTSGPIIKKKLWLFLDVNYETQQQSQPVLAYLPSGVLQTDALSPVTLDRFLGRLDWQPTQSHRLGVKYELRIDKAENSGVGGFSLPDLATNLFHRDYRVEISDQYVFSPELVNNFRIALGTNYQRLSSVDDEPQVIVQGAFSNGGAQVNEWRREPRTDMIDTVSYVKGPNEWKFGVSANLHPFRSYNADNFRGTYNFASLAAFEGGQPTLFTISAGDPLLSFQQNDYAWFAQYERKIGSASLFAGVRNEFQSGMPQHLNLAPRLAAAFAPGKDHRTVVRLGGGIFYDRRPPPLLEQSLRFNGIQTQQYILENPVYPVADPARLGAQAPSAVWRLDPNMVFPRIYEASASIERQLPCGFVLVTDYTYQRGNHLFRARDLNASLPVSGILPYPTEGFIGQLESTATSRGNVLNWTLRSPPNRRFQFFAQYTLSRLYDDTGGAFPPPPGMSSSLGSLFAALLPANNYDLHPEWGRANNDARNRFGLSGTAQLPWQFTFGTLTTIRSGLPFNITTGQDDNGDGIANDRPAGVGRNSGEGPGQFSVDVHLGRKLTIHRGERKFDIEIGVDSFNVLNKTNFVNYVGVITSPLFGRPNAAYSGRQMQLTLQIHF